MDNRDSIEYIGIIDSTVNIDPNYSNTDIMCRIKVDIPIEPVEYIAIINSYVYNPKNKLDIDLNSNLNIDKHFISDEGLLDDIESKININKYTGIYGIISEVKLDDYLINNIDLDSSIYYKEIIYNTDINCEVIFKALYEDNIIDGDCNIELEENTIDLDSDLLVDRLLGYKDINTSVNVMANPIKKNLIFGNLKYEKGLYNYDLNSELELAEFIKSIYIQSQIKVIKKRYYYSIFSRIKVVNRSDTEIPCSITVFNDQLHDIFGDVDILPISGLYDIMTDCNLYMQDYITKDIEGSFILDHTWTRKDIPIYMYVVHGLDTEIECQLDVFNPSYKYTYDIPCTINASMNTIIYDISSSIITIPVKWMYKDIVCKFYTSNRLAPAKIGIVIDPLWKYEPFVIQAVLVTFLERITTKNELAIVYGGNPRSDWDIEHYSKIFGIDRKHMLKSPIIYDNRNPSKTKDSIDCYINNLISFDPDNEYRKVDRVFIFTNSLNNPQGSRLMNPIVKVCKENMIPCLSINSQGDYLELVKWWEDNPCHPHLSIHNPYHKPNITY